MEKTLDGKALDGDTVAVAPAAGLKGELRVPGDKSVSHRAVFLGSIAEGATVVEGFLEGEDNLATIRAFRSMGVKIEGPTDGRLVVHGSGLAGLKEPDDVIDALNSGTTARLLAGLLSAQRFFSAITGDASLRRRPMGRVVEPLIRMGAAITGRMNGNLLPLAITGRRLKGVSYRTPVASAQVKSSILMAGLYAEGETVVEEPGGVISRDHTERMLKLFGADIAISGSSVRVGSTRALTGCKINVPGDISSAAFFLVGAAIAAGSELVVRGAGVNPTRLGIINILKRMGADLRIENQSEVSGEPVADIRVRGSRLHGVEISGEDLLPAIDEFPAICVAAAFADGETSISGARELRVKESDRIAAMASALRAVGVQAEERPDGVIINGANGVVRGGRVESLGDHRIAMAMAIAGLSSAEGVEIEGASSVQVSFPGFFAALDSVRA
jgi:3-phosphoshikimate 1-carboxyvinyltransferase